MKCLLSNSYGGTHGTKVGPSWVKLGPRWIKLSPSWAQVGPSWAQVKPSCDQLEPNLGQVGAFWCPFLPHNGPDGAQVAQNEANMATLCLNMAILYPIMTRRWPPCSIKTLTSAITCLLPKGYGGTPGTKLGPSWVKLGPRWIKLGPSWAQAV